MQDAFLSLTPYYVPFHSTDALHSELTLGTSLSFLPRAAPVLNTDFPFVSHFSPLYTVVINICFWGVSLPFAYIPLSKIGVEYFPHITTVEDEEEDVSHDEKMESEL